MVWDTDILDMGEDFLEHYGVKGMKWGVRRSDKELGIARKARETKKKVQTKKQEISARQQRIIEGERLSHRIAAEKARVRVAELKVQRKNSKGYVAKKSLGDQIKQVQKHADREQKKADKENRRLTDTQKKVLIGAGVATVVVGGVYARHKFHDLEGFNAAVRTKKNLILHGDVFPPGTHGGEFGFMSQVDAAMEGINPGYKRPGGLMNCRRCTMTYELRRRGYDVSATTSAIGYGQGESGLANALTKAGKNVYGPSSLSSGATFNASPLDPGAGLRNALSKDKRSKIVKGRNLANDVATDKDLAKNIRSIIGKHPKGARGEIVFDQGSFAHSLAWENVKGKIVLLDTQKNKRYSLKQIEAGAFRDKWGNTMAVDVTRLDNVDMDLEFLARWARG